MFKIDINFSQLDFTRYHWCNIILEPSDMTIFTCDFQFSVSDAMLVFKNNCLFTQYCLSG
jgi:hypothetical protein